MALNDYITKIKKTMKNIVNKMGYILGAVAFAATLATGYGTYAYLAGRWPFTEVEDRVYQPLQWFNESRGPVLEGPGTSWFVPPLVKKIKDKDGNIIFISAQYQERPCDFPFRTKDGLEGKLKMQYLYKVPDKKRAKKYFGEYGADPARIDEVVKGELSAKIGSIEGKFVAQGKYSDANNNLINYLDEAEVNANKKLLDENELDVGVEVKNFAILHIDFDTESERILQQEVAAIEAGKARLIQADIEKKEAQIIQEATANTMIKYLDLGRTYAQAEGDTTKAAQYALSMWRGDNYQQMSKSGAAMVNIEGGSPQSPIIVLPADLLKKQRDQDPNKKT